MSTVTNAAGYLENLVQSWRRPPAASLFWLDQLRAHAMNSVGTLRMPTTHDEEWRFTDISPLGRLPYPAARAAPKTQFSDISHYYLEEAIYRLVFVDGQFAPDLSNVANKADAIIGNLSSLITTHGDTIARYLGQLAELQNDIFTALNTAFLHDSACIIIPQNVSVTTPIHLLFISRQKEITSYPRCLVIAESGSNVTIVEDYVTTEQAAYVINSVVEMSLSDTAHVNHIRIQRDNQQAFHIGNCTVALAHASQYRSVSITLGAHISRYNLNVALAGEGAECTVDGLALISGHQLADTHTFIDHAKPHGKSRQLHKCIVDGIAHGVFNGRIMVRPHAQLTDSSQLSRNLLMTNKARIDTKPQLEIFADDVKCAHGATVGQLDKEEIFYLMSRGLSDLTARNLLTYAFGGEVIDRIAIPSLKKQLEEIILARTQIS
ncbi:Fe-S cluster assembly protein SufD [Nitrosomonas communis]|uniref:Fe-S cluster assembly protein SufD n=1 Tax=Nitrosomonas communis TaxID=44574 RepID=UPI0026EC8001|nr:Fe-S cluster assembly protein SufD [Nitrosomonas communis]MCO6426893.1 Fe-S cluster assembly protein SufD [Nitrosomonas communis]